MSPLSVLPFLILFIILFGVGYKFVKSTGKNNLVYYIGIGGIALSLVFLIVSFIW